MTDDRETDELLQTSFAELRSHDARMAPTFATMFAAAHDRAVLPGADAAGPRVVPDSEAIAVPSLQRAPRGRRALWWIAAPLLTAAGLGAVWLDASRRADREFDQTIAVWSHTTRPSLRTPTDGLLAVPGGEYLHSMPAIGSGRPVVRSGS